MTINEPFVSQNYCLLAEFFSKYCTFRYIHLHQSLEERIREEPKKNEILKQQVNLKNLSTGSKTNLSTGDMSFKETPKRKRKAHFNNVDKTDDLKKSKKKAVHQVGHEAVGLNYCTNICFRFRKPAS